MTRYPHFIAGSWSDSKTGSWMKMDHPRGAFEIASGTLLDLVRAVKAAHTPQKDWISLSLTERKKVLEGWLKEMAHERERLLLIIQNENLVPEEEASELVDETMASLSRILKLPELHSEVLPEGVFVNRQPVGLVGIIGARASSFLHLLNRIFPALLMGNPVICKPSSWTAATAHFLAETSLTCGVPAGLINFVMGSGPDVGEALAQHPAIHVLSFIGSTPVGQKVGALAIQSEKKFHLSLGARNPLLLFGDAPWEERWDPLVRSLFDFQLRPDLRPSRIFVQETIAKEFLGRLQEQMGGKKFRLFPDQMKTLKSVVALAQKEDARFAEGFQFDSSELAPAVISRDLTQCSTLQQEEVPGPFLSISSFKYQHEALKFTNTTPLAQAGYVWSGDLQRAYRVAGKMESALVFINQRGRHLHSAPIEGMKRSGMGRWGGMASLDLFSHVSWIRI